MWYKKNYLFFNIVISIFFITNLIIFSFKVEAEKFSPRIYKKIIRNYKKCFKIEKDMFGKLVFILSDKQLKKGTRLKLILKDQLGRKWIFKPGNTPFKAVVVYRLFTLFGIKTPEIHSSSININGDNVYGSIQRFISNEGNLFGIAPNDLTSNALKYMMRSHVISWLTSNYAAQHNNFIITSTINGKVDKLLRVDNDIALINLGKDELKLGYIPPRFNKVWREYYNLIWNSFITGKISLNLKKNYKFVKFVSKFPNEIIKKILINEMGNSEKIPMIIKRKKSLAKDFKEFYGTLIKKRGKNLNFSSDINYRKTGEQILKFLKKKIASLKPLKYKLNTTKSKQSSIKAKFSFKGYKIINELYRLYWLKDLRINNITVDISKLRRASRKAIIKLCKLSNFASNKLEKSAINSYLIEAIKINLGISPSYRYSEINKIVGSIKQNK